MCPLRFLLVLFSAVLAGYVAWRTTRSSYDIDNDGNVVSEDCGKMVTKDEQEFSSKRMVQNGFWVLVDMATGRYLWRNLRNDDEVKKHF